MLRRPVRVAVLAWAVYTIALGVWLLLPWDQGTTSAGAWFALLGIGTARVVVAVVVLTVLGLWRASGFTTPSTWRTLLPVLPLLLLPAFPLVFGPGISDKAAWWFAVGALSVATVAFGEEAVFRGVVLRVLLPCGVRPAVMGSAALFALMHLVNLVDGGHPITVAGQVLLTFGLGIGFAAVALATHAIWPLVVVHFAMDYANTTQAADPNTTAAAGEADVGLADLLLNSGINVALGALVAGYGLWLLHRRYGLLRELEAGMGPRQ